PQSKARFPMQTARALLALLALAPTVPGSPSRTPTCSPISTSGSEVPLTWHGKRYTTADAPLELGPLRRQAVDEWADWAAKAGYKMDFDAQGRLLLITPANDARTSARLKVVASAETWFDTALPAPDRSAAKNAPESGA